MLEKALILGLVALAIVGAASLLGSKVEGFYDELACKMDRECTLIIKDAEPPIYESQGR